MVPVADRADLRACRRVIRHHARSFSFAALFLPAGVRDDVAVVYAYYRLLDDLVDEPAGPGSDREVRAVLVADAPDPDHPLAPRDPSGVDPAMRRWVSGETIALLCEAAGLTSIAHRVIAADGAASWIAVSAVRAATDARPGGE